MKIPFYQNLIPEEYCNNMTKKVCRKKSSLPKYNNQETVNIEELHYVNQWYDNTKIINKS